MRTTIHRETLSAFRLELSGNSWRERHPRCPERIAQRIERSMRRAAMRRAARAGIERAGEINTGHLWRDYRPGIGSGRTAHWYAVSFRHYSILARTIHREMGYSGDVVRRLTQTLMDGDAAAAAQIAPCRAEPRYVYLGYTEEFERSMRPDTYSDEAEKWRLWLRWNGGLAIAQDDLCREIERLIREPRATINESPGSDDDGTHGYEGCSGRAWYALVRARPDLWDYLLSRAPRGNRGKEAL